MLTSVSTALSAYSSAAGQSASPGMAARDTDGETFGSLVAQAAKDTIGSLKTGEQMSTAAALGKADLTDVVAAVNSAEVNLQAVVAMRDKFLTAYQQILTMPM
jgi:flagellar hook-basal body complex protein FliE